MALTLEQLGQKVKAKYPEYSDLHDADLGNRVANKFPVYQKQVTDYKPEAKNLKDQHFVNFYAGNKVTEAGKVEKPNPSILDVPEIVKKTAQEEVKLVPNLLKEAGRQDESTSKNPIIRTGENALGVTASGLNTVFSPITNTVRQVSDSFAESDAGKAIYSNPVVGKVLDLFGKGSDKLESWAQQHPEAARNLNNLLVVGTTSAGAKTGLAEKPIGSIEGIKSTATDIGKGTIEATKNAVKPVVDTIGNKIVTGARESGAKLSPETAKLQETVSPKLSSKEIKLAQKQGRLVSGKESTLLKGGTPDSVLPSDKVIQSTQTIQREIPNASKMKSPELYTALEARTTDMARKLKPEMKKVPIKPETVEKITTEWEGVKKAQNDNPYIPSDVNVNKLQADFESRLMKSKSGNMDDLWETAIAYDSSVPTSVKNANSLSSESLQAKKEIWLQNRAVLRDAITDTKNAMGEKAANAFSDMHDMYNAKENILSKSKVSEASPSKIKQWIKNNPWKAALGGYITGKAIEEVTGINVPGI